MTDLDQVIKSEGSMEIRPATEADFDGIVTLMSRKDELFWIFPRGQPPFTLDQLEKIAIARQDLTVMMSEGTIVGFADLYDVREAESAFIGNVVVDASVRGKGWGRALVSHMVDLGFRTYGLKEVKISVFSENTPALLLYSSLEFKPYAVEERRDPNGRRVALIHMGLEKEFHRKGRQGTQR